MSTFLRSCSKVDVPGTDVLVDHSLGRAFNKGALRMLKVAELKNRITFSAKEIDAGYLGTHFAEATASGGGDQFEGCRGGAVESSAEA